MLYAPLLPMAVGGGGGRHKQEAHGPHFTHLSKTAIAYLQMSCNILPVLPQQLGQKFDRAVKTVKGHPWIIIWTSLVDLASLMLYTKIQPQSFLGSGEDFKCFYHIWACQTSCSIVQNHLNKLLVSLQQKASCKSWLKLPSSFREEDI